MRWRSGLDFSQHEPGVVMPAGDKIVAVGPPLRSALSRHILPRSRSVRYSTTRHCAAHRPLAVGSYPAGAGVRAAQREIEVPGVDGVTMGAAMSGESLRSARCLSAARLDRRAASWMGTTSEFGGTGRSGATFRIAIS